MLSTATVRAPIESTAVHEPLTLCFTYTVLTCPIDGDTAAPNGATRPDLALARAHAPRGFPRRANSCRLLSSTARWFVSRETIAFRAATADAGSAKRAAADRLPSVALADVAGVAGVAGDTDARTDDEPESVKSSSDVGEISVLTTATRNCDPLGDARVTAVFGESTNAADCPGAVSVRFVPPTDDAVVTVSADCPLTCCDVAVIVVVPAPTAVMTAVAAPADDIAATAGLLDAHATAPSEIAAPS